MLSTVLDNAESITIARARAGDGHAFSQLVNAYQGPIYNLCIRMLDNAPDAEEAAQETFLRAYTRLHSYDMDRPFKTCLFAIAHHYCIDCLRRRRLIWLSLDDEPALEPAHWRAATPTPEEQAMRREREADVQAALNALPPKDRSALIMRYWYGLSYEEIAQATASAVSAVKSRLHRARNALAPTEMLFLAHTIFFGSLFVCCVRAGRLDAPGVVFLCCCTVFSFYSVNYRTLVIRLTPESLKPKFGVFT